MKLSKLEKTFIAIILIMCLIFGFLCTNYGIVVKAEGTGQNPYNLSNPSCDASGNITWDCVWFGSYPQTEIVLETDETQLAAMGKMNACYETKYETVDDSTYQQIAGASYNGNGDATVNGVKYRRMKKGDAISSEFDNYCYYQWNDSTSYHYFRYEPIKWRVLSIESEGAFLLADVGLDNKCYNNKRYNKIYTGITWENTTMRSWLNGYSVASNKEGEDYSSNNFLCNAFSSAEQTAICNSQLLNEDNLEYSTDGGNNTIDKVFLLSINEALKTNYGFLMDSDNDIAKIAKTSTYAKAMGCCNYPDAIGCDGWWLRSLGETSDYATWVGDTGYLCLAGNSINCDLAVRPALHLNLSFSFLYSYAGTVSSDGTVNEEEPGRISVGESEGDSLSTTTEKVTTTTTQDSSAATAAQASSGTTIGQQLQSTTDVTKTKVTAPDKVKGVTLSRVGSSKLKVSYKKVKDAKGYQISYSTNKRFAKAKKLTVKSTKYTIKKLKKRKTYYVKVRAYKLNDSKKLYGTWSSTKKIKVK